MRELFVVEDLVGRKKAKGAPYENVLVGRSAKGFPCP